MSADEGRGRPWWRWSDYLLRRALTMELRGYQAIARLVGRRPRVPVGATGFSYHQPVHGLIVVIIVVSAVEVVAVDLAVSRWPAVRIPLLVVGIWGLLFMIGMLAGMITRPHAVGPTGMRVRSGAEIDIALPWSAVESVELRKRTRKEKEPVLTVDDSGSRTYHLRISDLTNIDVRLDRPTELRLPSGVRTVDVIALYAEDPRALLQAVRDHAGRPADEAGRSSLADSIPGAGRAR